MMKARKIGRKTPRRPGTMTHAIFMATRPLKRRKTAKHVSTPDECVHKRHLDSVDLAHRPIRTCSDCGSRLVTLTASEAQLCATGLSCWHSDYNNADPRVLALQHRIERQIGL